MNNNQISNPKVEVSKGFMINDKDHINCLLASLKEMAKNYTTAMTEASNDSLYNELKTSFEKIILLQREVYEVMFRKGWYIVEKSDSNKINTKFNTLSSEYQDLSF